MRIGYKRCSEIIKIGAADLPNGKPGAVFLTAVFDVAADKISKNASWGHEQVPDATGNLIRNPRG